MAGKAKDGKKRKRQAGVSGIATAGKKEVVFDDAARNEWLTGFSKRKQQRRKYGLAMQALKDRQHKLDERKARRDANRSAQGLPQSASNAGDEDGTSFADRDEEIVEEADLEHDVADPTEEVKLDDPSTAANSMSFNDQDTTSMFGGVVTVTTSLGLDEEDADAQDEEGEPSAKAHRSSNSGNDSKRRKQQIFDTAMKKAAIQAKRRKQHSKPNPFRAQADAGKLLNKATGKVMKKKRR